ncbi:RNA binding repeat domain-containing protein [Ordospora colligata]|uniref:RNA binding repeat domain-containing protein n=1 Tax=Ordospora colligata OC4 TaxID=1354746 RepID=A0A0B2UI76_9MICR|nr:RNA binding repeat domain-containing protein [Ordospora colligata OC4]KHN68939.1 RNA binding repeat domain-containing protein [Ordospora colligata OC4]TBU13973.1 RNA binding repeat domain-containing protein [Ordospora colligata]TBU14162.1 RNA binding repeat domain-containing protein [Ordospora colligata]TBU17831.1 RNA binding repeat domain-containing protein [Ordospora colligata]
MKKETNDSNDCKVRCSSLFEGHRHRPISAPPVDKLFLEDEVELGDIQTDLNYSMFYRRNCKNEPRLQPPNFFMRGQSGHWTSQYDDLIAKAFSNTGFLDVKTYGGQQPESKSSMSLAERIDEDYPESEKSIEYKGSSRATTPIGDANVLDTEAFNAMLNIRNKSFNEAGSKGCRSVDAYIKDIEGIASENEFLRELLEIYEGQEGINKCGDFSVKDICVSVSKDQEGSRCIQKKMEDVSREDVSWFFGNIVDASPELSANLFGNYVIQKIIPLLSNEERDLLITKLAGQVHLLSVHPYGCRVVQRLVDVSSNVDFILEEVNGGLLELIEDQNGNHVVQKCIEKCSDRRSILKQFEKNSLFLATHKYGCRVIQRMLEFCKDEEVKEVVDILMRSIDILVDDQYGNYVIQHILTVGRENERSVVIDKIVERSYELSKCKFSSNVVEQCVRASNSSQRRKFLKKFLEPVGTKPKIYLMCVDMYGNYVVQRLYDSSGDDVKNEIKNSLRPFIKDLKKSPFARHILFKISS